MIEHEVSDMVVQSFLVLPDQVPEALFQRLRGMDQRQDLFVRYGWLRHTVVV
jgi:hypothetical protein